VDDFEAQGLDDGYYLVVSELAPYKRIDLAVEAFNTLRKPLVVIGQGSELARLRRSGKDNITFLGSQPFEVLKRHYERCRALIFPGIEDFGITPLEAQAAGKPVIGFADGGLLETAVDGETALLFREQTAASLAAAVRAFEERAGEFEPGVCRAHALRFGPERFRREMKALLGERYPGRFADYTWPEEGG
jgi:glycosyltransferase involved in cell wall biosynthesis